MTDLQASAPTARFPWEATLTVVFLSVCVCAMGLLFVQLRPASKDEIHAALIECPFVQEEISSHAQPMTKISLRKSVKNCSANQPRNL